MATAAVQQPNGHVHHSDYGDAAVDGILKEEHKPSAPSDVSKDDMQLVLQSFRLLVADLCEQFNMGHPGSAIGMAALGVALWKHTMKLAPRQPDWFNRDRFLLSNGESILQTKLAAFVPSTDDVSRSRVSLPIRQSLFGRL